MSWNDLFDFFGNFINRVVVLTNKYWDGVVPSQNDLDSYEKEVLEKLAAFPNKIGESIEKFRFREALAELMNLARLGNKYLADTEPWKLNKEDEKRSETIMYISLQIAASLSVLSHPFLPFSSKKLNKTDFFIFNGYPEKAEIAKHNTQLYVKNYWLGGISFMLSTVVANVWHYGAGTAIFYGGIGYLYINYNAKKLEDASLKDAKIIAEKYNNDLMQKIINEND